jgi:hypothetical protein
VTDEKTGPSFLTFKSLFSGFVFGLAGLRRRKPRLIPSPIVKWGDTYQRPAPTSPRRIVRLPRQASRAC